MLWMEAVMTWFRRVSDGIFYVQFCVCNCRSDVSDMMNLPPAGSVHDLMQAHFHEGLPEMAIAFILRDVLEALNYLHYHGIIHRCVPHISFSLSRTSWWWKLYSLQEFSVCVQVCAK